MLKKNSEIFKKHYDLRLFFKRIRNRKHEELMLIYRAGLSGSSLNKFVNVIFLNLIKVKSIFLKFNRTGESMVQYRLLIGNPGVGKSTLANCIAKKILFKSGVNFGQGLTSQLGENQHNGVTYLDTPGLADMKLRKEAAKAITEGLKKNGVYQIFFVVTLESGRLRPADLATIKLVLENAEDITSYSLIINKLSKRVHETLLENDQKEAKRLTAEVDSQVGKNKNPPELFLLLNNIKLYDAENEFMTFNDLDKFVTLAPWVELNSNNVKDIPGDDKSFEEAIVLVTEELNKLRSDKKQMTKQLNKTEERCNKLEGKKVKFFHFILILYLLIQ